MLTMSRSRKKNTQAASYRGSAGNSVDNTCWVIVGLTTTGEKETNIDTLANAVYRLLKTREVEIFVPAISQTVRGVSETMFYMQGYIFVEYLDGVSYLRLKDTTYFSEVLCNRKGKGKTIYNLLPNSEVIRLKQGVNNLKFSEFEENDEVKIVKGNYKNLSGIVSCVYSEEKVQVAVMLRSKQLLMDFPCTYIEKK